MLMNDKTLVKFRLCWHTNGWRSPCLEWVTLGLSQLLRLVWEETHTHTLAADTHSCFVRCALLMKDSLIFLSTRWLYLNCCLGFLASCPIALEFMSCSPEWRADGSRIAFWQTSQCWKMCLRSFLSPIHAVIVSYGDVR